MSSMWEKSRVILQVKAKDETEAAKAVADHIKPESIHTLSLPFLQSVGIFSFEVIVRDRKETINRWSNAFKTEGRPALYASFESSCVLCGNKTADMCDTCAGDMYY